METPKHTPGPWKDTTKPHNIGASAIEGDGKQLVALVYGGTKEEREANAALIIAAPDLLESAKRSLMKIGIYALSGEPVSASHPALVALRAAIAKAEGRS